MSQREKRTTRFGWGKGAAVVAALVLGAVIVLVFLRREEAPEEVRERPNPPVEVVVVREMTLDETVTGIGTLRASATVRITPETAGRVRNIPFEEGSRVEEGEVLIELDDAKLQRQISARQAAVRAAEVRVINAERTFRRQEQLAEQGVVSEDDFDRAQAELDSALADADRQEAELELAREQLNDMTIRAPFDGEVSERQVDRGAYVGIGEVLATFYQSDPLEISFAVPERYLGRVQHGQAVQVTVPAFPGESFDGTVDFISPAIDEATRTLSLKAVVANTEGRLSPGISGAATVTVDRLEDQPVVPEEALVATRRGYLVFVVEDDVAHSREVQTALRQDGMVQVVEGVLPGERIVRAGHMRINDGQPVRVLENATADTEPSTPAQSGGGE